MKAIKLNAGHSLLEGLEWKVRCAKHQNAGGKVTINGEKDGVLNFNCTPSAYEIVAAPEYEPYSADTRDQVKRDEWVKKKSRPTSVKSMRG